ncbi:MAG: hypothetical protein K2J83_01425 [Clostridia bacterium]|nr:hypothetical protein [Clostridia bacterium]
MKKTLISITAALALIVAVLCMGLTMTACKPTSYVIKVVYEDGTPVNGLTDGTAGVTAGGDEDTKIQVQICAANPETEQTGFCTEPIDLGADGTISFTESQFKGNTLDEGFKWHVQLLGVKDGFTYEDLYLDGYNTYTITLVAQN